MQNLEMPWQPFRSWTAVAIRLRLVRRPLFSAFYQSILMITFALESECSQGLSPRDFPRPEPAVDPQYTTPVLYLYLDRFRLWSNQSSKLSLVSV
jgi:hypothetical protein